MFAKVTAESGPLTNRSLRRSYPIIVCAAVSLALNVWLIRDNVKLRSAIDRATGLKIGERVAPFDLTDSEGRKLHISYNTAPKGLILYYFSPNCRWSLRNGPNLNALAKAVGDRYQIVSYTSDFRGLPKYVARAAHHVQVATDDSVNIQKLLKLSGTPQTIEFDPSGVVVSNWQGAYVGPTLKEVERHFQVKLPGLSEQ
jgi:hypothetical protein